MLLGICQALQNQLLNSFSTQMHGQALFIIHTGWFYMTGKQLDGGYHRLVPEIQATSGQISVPPAAKMEGPM